MEVNIQYDGEYPNLCSGTLLVTLKGVTYDFGRNSLCSGGTAYLDDDNAVVTEGEWSINKWPENFPDSAKAAVLRAINCEIQCGCCGGCV
jgi:hypothetical protein